MGLRTNVWNTTINIYTVIPCSSQGLGSKTPKKKQKSATNSLPPIKTTLQYLLVFFFSLQTHCYGKLPQLLKHHAVWLTDLLEMPNNFDIPVHRRAWMMYFYFLSDSSNLETHNKKGITVNVRKATTNKINRIWYRKTHGNIILNKQTVFTGEGLLCIRKLKVLLAAG
jgi:hypothetical protein